MCRLVKDVTDGRMQPEMFLVSASLLDVPLYVMASSLRINGSFVAHRLKVFCIPFWPAGKFNRSLPLRRTAFHALQTIDIAVLSFWPRYPAMTSCKSVGRAAHSSALAQRRLLMRVAYRTAQWHKISFLRELQKYKPEARISPVVCVASFSLITRRDYSAVQPSTRSRQPPPKFEACQAQSRILSTGTEKE